MINEKKMTVSWLSGLLSAEIFIQMPPLTGENSHFLRSGAREAALVMPWWEWGMSKQMMATTANRR